MDLERAKSGSRQGSVIDLESDADTLIGTPRSPIKREGTIPPTRITTIKREAREASTLSTKSDSTIVPSIEQPRGVKREREDADDIEEMAQPPKKPLILVDLTEDDS